MSKGFLEESGRLFATTSLSLNNRNQKCLETKHLDTSKRFNAINREINDPRKAGKSEMKAISTKLGTQTARGISSRTQRFRERNMLRLNFDTGVVIRKSEKNTRS